eukprot:1159578-Pelagomonas_calceolata.AAC.1
MLLHQYCWHADGQARARPAAAPAPGCARWGPGGQGATQAAWRRGGAAAGGRHGRGQRGGAGS